MLASAYGELPTAEGDELVFWRQLAKDCAAFVESLRLHVDKVKGDARKVKTSKGEGRLVKGTDMGVKVDIGGEVVDVAWAEFRPEDLAPLARAAFEGQGPELNAQLAAFAFAHRLQDVFFQVEIAVEASGESGPAVDQVRRELARADKRFAPPEPKKPGSAAGPETGMQDAGMQDAGKPDETKPPK